MTRRIGGTRKRKCRKNLAFLNQNDLITHYFFIDFRSPQYQCFGPGTTMASYVAETKQKLRDKTSAKNPSYPEGIKDCEVVVNGA